MNVYEVFSKPPGKDPFEHVGSLEASDDELALLYARETYVRRGEGTEVWVVDRRSVLRLAPEEIVTNASRHHATNDGHVVAERRKRRRVGRVEGTTP